MTARYFTEDRLDIGEFYLTGDEAHHLTAVMRANVGDAVVLFNGDGAEYPATVIAAGKKSTTLHITARLEVTREVGWPIVVGCALPKGDRFDVLLEKLTELGCTRFIPMTTARSVVVPKADKLPKWRRAVVEASKQCGRNLLMTIDAPVSFADYLQLGDLPQQRVLLHPGEATFVKALRTGVAVAIGPEGGFTDGEVSLAKALGWQSLALGHSILRIETAAIAAVCWATQAGA